MNTLGAGGRRCAGVNALGRVVAKGARTEMGGVGGRRCGAGNAFGVTRIRWLPPEGTATSPSKQQPPNLRLLDGCDRLLRSRNHCRGR